MAVRRTLQQSLALNFALVALVPLLLLVVAALYRLSLVNDEVSARNRGLARAVSSQAALFLNGPRTTLEQLRHWLQVLGADDLRLQSILDAEAESSALFEVFYLLDEDDRVAQVGLPSAQRPLRSNYLGLDLSGRHFVTRSRESGLPQWSDTFLSVISGQISLALAVPVNGRVLVGDFSIQRLSRFLDELELERRILPLILDHMGNIIAHPSAQFSAQQINLANQALVKQALGGDPMTGPFDFAGERYIGTVVPVSASDWLTLVGERTETAYRESRSIIGILLGAMVLAIALALGVAIILARRLVWPIRVFSERAARFGAGDYEADMPRAPVRELDRLAQAFSDMRSAVQDWEQRLAESERQYRRLVEGTDNLITRVDTEGRFTFVNSTAETVYGVPAPQCIGRSAFDFIHPEDRERTRRAFLGWLRGTRDRYSFQNRQIGEHGETRDMLWTISVDRNVEGVVVGLDSIARDITELKRTESTLRQQRAVIEKFAREEQVLLSLSRLSLGVLPLEAFLQRCITCLTTEARWLKLESRGAVLLRQHANRVPAVAATVGLESGLPDGIIGPYRKESTDAGRLCK
ncbi:MAG: PAS domain S-box protein, partial [Candidatus Competibacterales bacterium]|nr:PAS domain S-box protein [Candidatus Competibacterales bacterium]